MKRILCALLIFSMLIIPAACQRTEAPDGEKTVTGANTAAPGQIPVWDDEEGETSARNEDGAQGEGEDGEPARNEDGAPVTAITAAVPDKEVKSISIKTGPKNTVYYAGSPIDTTGLTVNVKFKDGTEKTIAGGYGYSPATANEGVKKITVSYGGKTDTFSIKVKDDALKGISVKSKPNRQNYAANEKIDTAGLVINAQYESGTVRAVSDGFTVSPASFSSAGQHSVTVSYGGKTATFTVTVRSGKSALVSTIRVTQKPKRTVYYLGEKLDTSGMIVTVNYTDGTSEELKEGFKCAPVNLSEKGVQKIIVTYGSKSTAFNVTVKEDTVKGITIKKGPNKINYYQGDVLDTEGLELTVDFENAASKTITSGFACTPTHLNEPGLQEITVTYAGKKRTFTVRVKEDTLESIEIMTGPSKRTYYVGDTLDTKGLTVRAVYLSGRVVALTGNDVTCSPSVFRGEGASVPVAVSYGGKTVHFGVKVIANPVKEIFVDKKPTKTYKIGDTVSKDDITVKVKYENGNTETITGFTLHNAQIKKAGPNYIEVTYGDYATGFTVNAEDTVTDIYIELNPKKLDYKKGEKLDTSGMTVKAKYASGDTKTVTDECYVSPRDLNGIGQQKITVVYQGLTAYFYVTVTE
ncbi:MAG: bacterial Ig-like domain-containing protein [Clostridia bacterium]|nr:bacterial Ig-like domain-containing protein [Clostridia bacterium]